MNSFILLLLFRIFSTGSDFNKKPDFTAYSVLRCKIRDIYFQLKVSCLSESHKCFLEFNDLSQSVA